MKLIFFFKMSKIFFWLQNCYKNLREIFSTVEILAFKSVAGFFLNKDENTCDRQWSCYQKVLRLRTCLREMFSNSTYCRLLKNWDKSAALHVSAVFGTLDPLRLSKGVLKQKLSGIEVTTFLGVNNFRNIKATKLTFFLKTRKISCRLQKSNKILKKCFRFLS